MLELHEYDTQASVQDHKAILDKENQADFHKNGIDSESIEVKLEIKEGSLQIKP